MIELLIALLISVFVLLMMVVTFNYAIKFSSRTYDLVRDTDYSAAAAINLWQQKGRAAHSPAVDFFQNIESIDTQIASDFEDSLVVYEVDSLYGASRKKLYVSPKNNWK